MTVSGEMVIGRPGDLNTESEEEVPVVVASFLPYPGNVTRVVDAFREVSPQVHEEAGCELYAIHQDGRHVVVVERWSSQADLDAHAEGAPLRRLKALTQDLLVRPYSVRILEEVPIGDPAKGTIPRSAE